MGGSKTVFRGESILALLDGPGRRLLDFWMEASAAGLPSRSNFEPLDHLAAWPGIQIVDVLPSPDEFRYRLVGTREVEVRGRDPTGETVAEGFFGDSAESVLENYRITRLEKCPICVLGNYRKQSGLPV